MNIRLPSKEDRFPFLNFFHPIICILYLLHITVCLNISSERGGIDAQIPRSLQNH